MGLAAARLMLFVALLPALLSLLVFVETLRLRPPSL
jgi:hypothetical protein